MVVAIAVSAIVAMLVSPVAAQETVAPKNPDLVVNSSTEYVVDPEAGSVVVDVEYVLVNSTTDTPVTEFSEVLPIGATDILVNSGSQPLGAVRVGTSGDSGSWIIPLVTVLRPGRSVNVSLSYTLLSDHPGASDSDVIINPAYVSLPIYSTGGSSALHSVSVTLPSNFHVVAAPGLEADGSTDSLVLTDSGVLRPYSTAVVVATDTSKLNSLSLPDLGVGFVMKSWPGHDSWSTAISDASRSIVTQLTEWFGAPPVESIDVVEGSVEAYPDIEVATPVDGSATLVVDESADIGALGRQLAKTWIGNPLPKIPWFDPAAIDVFGTVAARLHDPEASGPDATVEGFDVAAHELLDSVIVEIGGAKLAAVISSVESGAFTYPGPGADGADPLPADWHTLLDTLRIKGGSGNTNELFRQFLTDPADIAALDQHAISLASYERLVDQAHGWQLPMWVRLPMAEWDFTTFEAHRAEAEATLMEADALSEEATAAGVDLGDHVMNSFEQATDGMSDTEALIIDQRSALEAIVETERVSESNSGLLSSIGLIGTDVEARRSEIEGSFAAGRFEMTRQLSEDLIKKIEGSNARGVLRLVIPSAVVAGFGFAVVEVVRRRRSRSTAVGEQVTEVSA